MTKSIIHQYSKEEERLNVISHGFGLILALIAFPFLVYKANQELTFSHSLSYILYGLSMIILYAASTFYHAEKKPSRRRLLNITDHAAIYLLIAGSYSPFCINVLNNTTGWYLFIAVWTFAAVGVILKLFFTGRFDKLSTILYVLMGWQVIFFIKPLIENLPTAGLYFLVLGGISYTIGAVLYSIKRLKYNHAIFHCFVLIGSILHFISIFYYI